MFKKSYYIYKHSIDGVAFWWKHNDHGYDGVLSNAKKFTESAMVDIIGNPYQKKIAYPCEYVDSIKKPMADCVFDSDLDITKSIGNSDLISDK